MADSRKQVKQIKLTGEQKNEGYWVEMDENVLVWHHKNQIALLLPSADIQHKVQDVIERNRQALREVEEKTGWKAT